MSTNKPSFGHGPVVLETIVIDFRFLLISVVCLILLLESLRFTRCTPRQREIHLSTVTYRTVEPYCILFPITLPWRTTFKSQTLY